MNRGITTAVVAQPQIAVSDMKPLLRFVGYTPYHSCEPECISTHRVNVRNTGGGGTEGDTDGEAVGATVGATVDTSGSAADGMHT